jgi:hypothetical protein
MGEQFWDKNSLGVFAVGIRTLRLNDWCYMSGWSWLNYWPNFLQGMSHEKHAWKPKQYFNQPDRVDSVDGWGSPLVEFTQRSLHPYLIQDAGILAENPAEPHQLGGGKIEWPYNVPRVTSGDRVERTEVMFNGGLSDRQFDFVWSAHWDSPDGAIAVAGGKIPCEIEPGFHRAQKIAFTVPAPGKDGRRLYLVMESQQAGRSMFREDGVYLNVGNK